MINKERILQLVRGSIEPEPGTVEGLIETQDSIEGWDSLTHLSILVALDKELSGEASKLSELAACYSTNELFNVLKKHGLAK